MKIALNCCYYGETSGGIRVYIYNLIINLLKLIPKENLIFYISPDDEKYWNETMPGGLNYKKTPFKRDRKIAKALLEDNFWEQELINEGFMIFHSPFFHLPKKLTCKKIMTVHDLRFKKYPESYPFKRRFYLKYKVGKSIRQSDHIISISDFTKSEIINYFNISEKKVTTIHEAVDSDFLLNSTYNDSAFLEKNNLTSKGYILTVGHLEPRKNYLKLIEAYINLTDKGLISEKLVIIGKKNYKYNEILQKISYHESIRYLDFVEEEDLYNAYANAKIFVFPSIYEGFGFPPLEAAVFGIPSVVSNVSSIPEICGEGALYFDPFDIQSLTEKIYSILSDNLLYERTTSAAVNNLKRFSWYRNAEQTLKLYERIINEDE